MPAPSPVLISLPAGAAVVEVAQDLEAVGDDLVRFAALHVHDEADAAGIVLEPRDRRGPVCPVRFGLWGLLAARQSEIGT
jgi:hypothetical protein